MTSDTVKSATKATRTPASKGASRAVNQAASKAPAKVAKKAAKTKPATKASSPASTKPAKKAAKKAPVKSITKAAGKAASAPPAPAAPKPWHVVRRSPLHGNGVFAARKIPAGTRVMEYIGERISGKEADRRHPTNPDDPFHTFFFALSSGKVIDGGVGGNDARWINHSCTPNCESQEGRAGKRLYIVTLRDIARGEELFYDYGLVLDGKITKALKEGYKCLCGTPACRGTMLALPEKKKKKQGARSAA